MSFLEAPLLGDRREHRNRDQPRWFYLSPFRRFLLGAVLSTIIILYLLTAAINRTRYTTNDRKNSACSFPTLADTIEMVRLSALVYHFRDETDDDAVCQQINQGNFHTATPELLPDPHDYTCHWYHHDWTLGTQVMLVSSQRFRSIAAVFAGTDDLRTSLTDADVLTKPYGDNDTVTLADLRVRVHEGFDNAIFANHLYSELQQRIHKLVRRYPKARLFTTGHSLGAADSILLAVGLAYHYQKNSWFRSHPTVTSINFGCPRTGNTYWRDFVHTAVDKLVIWRFVLGYDLVPRLPELIEHVGHTVQLFQNGWTMDNATATVYYQHIGDSSLGYAGVPLGWTAKPFIWVPGALWSHHVVKYYEFLKAWAESPSQLEWIHEFAPVENHTVFPNVDDDFNMPDDWIVVDADE